MAIAWATYRLPLAAGVGTAATLRVVTELIGLVSNFGVNFPHVIGHNHAILRIIWLKWDAAWLASIAQYGYPSGHLLPGHQNAIAFAPLIPGPPGWFMTSPESATTAAGCSWPSSRSVIALVGVHRIVAADHGPKIAGTTVTLVAAWPAAFFLVTGYTESLALAAITWAFVAVRERHYLVAGVLAAAATMTKYYAIVLVVALAVELWDDRKPPSLLELLCPLAYLIVPALAFLVAWMIYCSQQFGDALAFVHAQAAWGRGFDWPWVLIGRTAGDLVHLSFLDTARASVVELFDAVTVLLLAVATVYTFVRVRRSYGVLLLLGLCVFVFENVLTSEIREVLWLFPFFLVLALWCQRSVWLERLMYAFMLPSADS